MVVPYPKATPENAAIIPAIGFLPLYRNKSAPIGINIAKPTSFIRLDIVEIKINKKVNTQPSNFNNFFLIIVSKSPVDSAIPTPKSDINSMLNGVKLIKFTVALLIK